MNKKLLEIKNLTASVENRTILKNLSLTVKENETHVIMGPNGSGKSTLSKVLAGHPSYKTSNGTVRFGGENLLTMQAETRAHKGLFLAFQSPIEIPGVSNHDFLRVAFNEKKRFLGELELDPLDFINYIGKFLNNLKIAPEFLNRCVNEGFSGGEKKRNEILQLLVLNPKLIILDEIDSGLDMDALKLVCHTIKENLPLNSSLILITHYPRILTYLKPSFVHIMIDGNIIKTGNSDLITKLEKKGYSNF